MPRQYTVKSGDNLWAIARAEGVDFEALKAANPDLAGRIPPYGINPGDRITVPDKKQGGAESKPPDPGDQKPGDCKGKCPPVYFLELRLIEASGQTDGGAGKKGFRYSGSLSDHRVGSSQRFDIGIYLDVVGDLELYKNSVMPTSATWTGSKGTSGFVELSEAQFNDLKILHIWSNDMRASFFVWQGAGNSLAKMRLGVPRALGVVEEITEHPKSKAKLPERSKKIVFSVMILESPAVYMLREINVNARSDDIPTTGVGWWARADEGEEWDYKHPIRRIWGDKMRLGNYAEGVDSGAFSNFHVGYVGAAGGNEEEDMVYFSAKSQTKSTGTTEPGEDKFAIESGHRAFMRTNGLKEIVHGKVTDIKQTVSKDLPFGDFADFLYTYQVDYNVLD